MTIGPPGRRDSQVPNHRISVALSGNLGRRWGRHPYSCAVDGYIKWIRDRVGSQKILVIYASICIVDDRGRLLWQQRGDFGWWGLPGGVLELDEDLATCAIREAKEETGFDVAITGLVGVYSSPDYDIGYPNGDEVQQITYCFRAEVVGGSAVADGVETLDLQWWDFGHTPRTALWYRDMAADLFVGGGTAGVPPTFTSGSRGDGPRGEPYFKLIRRHIGSEPFVAAAGVAAVFDDGGRLLLVRRADDGTWSLPGGMVELGERIDQTVVNEIKEETGLDIVPERLIGIHSTDTYLVRFPNGDRIKAASCLFRCRVVAGDLAPDLDEVLQARFFASDELPALPSRYKDRVATAFANDPDTIIS